ncbi:protein of unknown function (plasmid) [Denitratisoma oestradiolicum]|uniref:DUF945 domain-containing protein n=1 Tax=Denitratisoma oestradiolicum TaxID=311182 RepID=A0A6S6Y2Y0_9PROT|nr:protein of unknown function [Denitratisoma oestradiolicum]
MLNGLRRGGFQPFMACQTRVRDDGKREHTKHMIRLRHADQIAGREANEIILLNSHDGTSSYQMLAGMFRFVCQNGMVCGGRRTIFGCAITATWWAKSSKAPSRCWIASRPSASSAKPCRR